MRPQTLLLFVPLAIVAQFLQLSPTIVFILAFLALLPPATVLGTATEQLASYTGPKIGGLLNATLGTLIEFIILFALLRSGQIEISKAAIIGSVLLSVLIIVGMAMLLGGLKNGGQRFDQRSVGMAATTMILAVGGLLVPTFFAIADQLAQQVALTANYQDKQVDALSTGVALVLFVLYLLIDFYQVRSTESQEMTQSPECPSRCISLSPKSLQFPLRWPSSPI